VTIDETTAPKEVVDADFGRKFGALREDYDPYKVPPDFELAKRHKTAKAVSCLAERLDDDQEEDESQLCPCCNFPYESTSFNLCASIF
jgi:hypothetical protein